jgi:hypothetical protein
MTPTAADLAAVERLGLDHVCRGGTSADLCEECGAAIVMLWPEQSQVMAQLLASLKSLNVNLISTATAKERTL